MRRPRMESCPSLTGAFMHSAAIRAYSGWAVSISHFGARWAGFGWAQPLRLIPGWICSMYSGRTDVFFHTVSLAMWNIAVGFRF